LPLAGKREASYDALAPLGEGCSPNSGRVPCPHRRGTRQDLGLLHDDIDDVEHIRRIDDGTVATLGSVDEPVDVDQSTGGAIFACRDSSCSTPS